MYGNRNGRIFVFNSELHFDSNAYRQSHKDDVLYSSDNTHVPIKVYQLFYHCIDYTCIANVEHHAKTLETLTLEMGDGSDAEENLSWEQDFSITSDECSHKIESLCWAYIPMSGLQYGKGDT